MEILCETCHAKLNIPNEKLPAGQRVSVKCPRCGNKLGIDAPAARTGTSDASDQIFKKPAGAVEELWASSETKEHEAPPSDELPGLNDTEADSALDSYGEGEKLALIMIAETRPAEKITEALDKLGYNAIQAKNTREALSKMQFQNFDLIILSDLFDHTPLNQSPILQYLNHLSMSVRRKMFVLLVSDAFRTMDHMMAFAMSVNLLANWKDLGRLSNILGRALSDNEKFYKVFMDILKETGKA